jgi:zinc transporter, ZIP family
MEATVSDGQILLLGFIAGATILLGLPMGRLRRPAPELRQLLNAAACGILIFLLWDVLAAGFEPLEEPVEELGEGHGGEVGEVLGYGVLFFGGLTIGLMGLIYYEAWMTRRIEAQQQKPHGPGAMSAEETRIRGLASWSTARQLALLIAVGIGLHNFAEGLAIGGAAAADEIDLAIVLVIGFGLHNATEGFGITAPLAAEGDRPSWPFLLGLGAIAGGPTFVGTLIGQSVTSEPVSVIFLTLAAGSILYVVIQLIGIGLKHRRTILGWGILLGLTAGFVTDLVIDAAGV